MSDTTKPIHDPYRFPVGDFTADRIYELETQRDALHARVVKHTATCTKCGHYVDAQDANEEAKTRIAELEALVQRHEAALEWICSGEYDCWKHVDDGTYRVNCVCHPGVNCKAIADTPITAIEAAMKEEKMRLHQCGKDCDGIACSMGGGVIGSAAPAPASPFAQQVRQITTELADMLIAKNKAYGNSALDPVRVFSQADTAEQIRVRIDDKLSRLQRGNAHNEDTILDLMGYLVLLRIAEAAKEAKP